MKPDAVEEMTTIDEHSHTHISGMHQPQMRNTYKNKHTQKKKKNNNYINTIHI